ncbi:ATP-binding protein [Streptomyces iakyrus]|uniref:ATP-binding protein n=1 Tax=Streptomyces iakyrus TaxID=68219 RepID=UPI0036EE3E5E
MLESLDARLAQAHGGELGHLDFLQVLCQDEITRRETVAFQRRLQRAKFEQQVTLEEFDFTASSKLPAVHIRDLGAPTSPTDTRTAPGRNGSASTSAPTS